MVVGFIKRPVSLLIARKHPPGEIADVQCLRWLHLRRMDADRWLMQIEIQVLQSFDGRYGFKIHKKTLGHSTCAVCPRWISTSRRALARSASHPRRLLSKPPRFLAPSL